MVLGVESMRAWIIGASSRGSSVIAVERAAAPAAASSQRSDASKVGSAQDAPGRSAVVTCLESAAASAALRGAGVGVGGASRLPVRSPVIGVSSSRSVGAARLSRWL